MAVFLDVLPENFLVVVDLLTLGLLLVLDLLALDLLVLDFDKLAFGAELLVLLKLEERDDDEWEDENDERLPPLNPLASAKLGTIKIKVNNKVIIAFVFIFCFPSLVVYFLNFCCK